MKDINFHKVEMENFCGYIEPMEFTFENSKITLISGKNGIGKSTVFSAIPYALYGMTQTGQTSTDVLNNKTERNCVVKCYFSIDGVKYKVVRGIKSPKSATNASLFIEGSRDPIAKGARETTQKIEELLVPKELFLNTILFGQKVKSFFTDLPDSKQKEIFRKILQLDDYLTYKKNAADELSNLLDESLDTANAIGTIKQVIESVESNINTVKEKIKEKQSRLKDTNEYVKILNEQKLLHDDELNEMDEENTRRDYDNLMDKKKSLKNELNNLDDILTSKINEMTAVAEATISKLKEENSVSLKVLSDTLNTKISDNKDKLAKHQKEINDEINRLREEYADIKSKLIDEKNNRLNILNKSISDIKDEKLEKTAEINKQLVDELDVVNKEEKEIVDALTYKYNDTKQELERNLTDINIRANDVFQIISKEKMKIETASDKIKQYKIAIDNKSTICPTCFQKWSNTDHIQKMIDDEELFINECHKNIKTYDESHKKLNETAEDLKQDIHDIKITHEKNLLKATDDFTNKRKNIKNTIDENIAKLEQEISTKINDLEDKINDLEKDFGDEVINRLNNKYIDLANKEKNKISNIEKEISNTNKELEDEYYIVVEKYNSILKTKITSIEEKTKTDIITIKNKFVDDKKKLSDNISNIDDNLILESKHKLAAIEGIKNKIQKVKDAIVEHKYIIGEIKTSIADDNELIKTLLDDIEKHNIKIKEYELTTKEITQKIKICEFWKNAFSSSGIPSMLIDESIPFMNRKISAYLDMMSNGRYIVTFDTLHETKSGEFKDKISVNVYDAETHSNSRVNLSGGQTKLVDIATILTLSDLQESVQKFKVNILLFDEIFDALDDENISNVSKLLRTIVAKDKAINIITHRHIDQVEADAIYNFG